MKKNIKKLQAALLLAAVLSFGMEPYMAAAAEAPAAVPEQPVIPEQPATETPAVPEQPVTPEQPAAEAPAVPEQPVTPEQPAAQTQQTVQNTQSAAQKKEEARKAEQLKKDIENSLKADAEDAVIDGYLSLLNKDYILRDELDLELVSIGNGHQLEPRAAEAVTQMVKDARKEGLYINITSSYRTYAKQVSLFGNKIERLEAEGMSHAEAVKEAGTVVAVPGTSEHQLGLTVDFVTGSYKKLDEGIRNTKEYKWVEEHAWEYGYVIRYPKDKSDITGIISEPWHLRYVGIPAAKLMQEQGICLEEFLGVAYDGQKDGISNGAGWANTGR